VESTEVSRCLD